MFKGTGDPKIKIHPLPTHQCVCDKTEINKSNTTEVNGGQISNVKIQFLCCHLVVYCSNST